MDVSVSRLTMQLRDEYEWTQGLRNGKFGKPAAGWGVVRSKTSRVRKTGLQREMSTGALPGSKAPEYVLYQERWLMLTIVSALALLSDWACFAAVGGTKAWVSAFNKNPEDLIDIFLFSNVMTCFLYTDLTRRFGLKKVITVASGLMAVGCALRSGAVSASVSSHLLQQLYCSDALTSATILHFCNLQISIFSLQEP